MDSPLRYISTLIFHFTFNPFIQKQSTRTQGVTSLRKIKDSVFHYSCVHLLAPTASEAVHHVRFKHVGTRWSGLCASSLGLQIIKDVQRYF